MDAFLTTAILDALSKGDVPRVLAYVLIFVFIWIEVRGLKKQFKLFNDNIAGAFKAGETRFEVLEKNQKDFEHRLTVLEDLQPKEK